MNDIIIAALIGAVASIIVNLIAVSGERKKKAVEAAISETKLDNRLRNIEYKLDIHNGYAEKLGNIEKSIAVIENDIKTLYKQG